MVIIICALKCEASPLITLLNLKLVKKSRRFYMGEGIILAVSGPGEINIKKCIVDATGESADKNNIFINYGVCGCTDKTIKPGTVFMVNEIHHAGTRKPFYPDMLFENEFKEAGITTFTTPSNNTALPTLLADMESRFFYETCLGFCSSPDIHVIKIVSDHMDPDSITKDYITSLVMHNRDMLAAFISRMKKQNPPEKSFDYSEYYDRYRFTSYLRNSMDGFNRYYFLKNGVIPEPGIYSGFSKPKTKSDVMEIYHEIRDRLI